MLLPLCPDDGSEGKVNPIIDDFVRDGYMIASAPELKARIAEVRSKFVEKFVPKFTDDSSRNRNIIKLLAESIALKRFFCSEEIVGVLHNCLGIVEPVQTGPIVSHYTSNDLTGNNYGLPYHQDWPSMGTSSRAVIAWTSIIDIGAQGPGLRVVPGSHARGLWPGTQTESGYILQQQDIEMYRDLEIVAGDVLFMSPFLVHKTRVSNDPGWKLSFSCRFDDFEAGDWSARNFVSAYKTSVDRDAYLK